MSAVAILLACTLDPSEKTACRTVEDCREGRQCVEQVCMDDPCVDYCANYCAMAQECGAVDIVVDCEQGCTEQDPSCDPVAVAPLTCSKVPDAGCYELAAQISRDVDCEVETPCFEDTDCSPTFLCDDLDHRCRKRCTENYECPGSECFSDHCAEIVGTPCDLDTDSWCGGGNCINVDANNRTVDPYCSVHCILVECPTGFVCFDDTECRKP